MVLRLARVSRVLLVTLVVLSPSGIASAGVVRIPGATADPAEVARLLALDCERLPGGAGREVLARMPAPRIINLSGSVPIVTMEAFAEFLLAMGYPEHALRDPRGGALAHSSYTSSAVLAGTLAWHYERDGLRPMLIGHSQGGMLVVRTLHELAGAFADRIPVFNPVTGTTEPRTTIRDPRSRSERPVVGVSVAFAAAIATGTLPRVLLGQWSMIPKLRKIPDTVDEFTGFTIAWDPIAGNLATAEPYAATGTAIVRNVTLPASYSHIGAPITQHLADNPVTRAWIEDYHPGPAGAPVPADPALDARNLLHAADLWFSVRKHWCREGQRLLATGS